MLLESDAIWSDCENSKLKLAQTLLLLFEADCGCAAVTSDEIKEWICAQGDDLLQFRVRQILSGSL